MPMYSHVSSQALDELIPFDNASVVDFLASTASVLSDEGLLAGKDVDNFRLTLSSIQSCKDERLRPLLGELVAQDAEFLHILTARYGERALAANLLRYGLRQSLTGVISSLSLWGQSLVDKAKLLFNRPFYLYVQGRCERQVLYSTLLVDFTSILEQACSKLARLRDDLSLFLAHRMASADDLQLQVDEKIAHALGFEGVSTISVPTFYDDLVRQEIALVVQMVVTAALAINEQLPPGEDPQAGSEVSLVAELLILESQRVGTVQFPAHARLAAFDVKRRLVLASIQALRHGLDGLASALGRVLSAPAVATAMAPIGRPPLDVERRMISELIFAGTPVKRAQGAVEDLFVYLSQNQIAAKDVLVAELNKINPCLTPQCLHILQELGQARSLVKVAVEEKQRTLRRSEQLVAKFSAHLATVGPALLILLCMVLTSACGLKMAPQSERLDYRPDVPAPLPPPPALRSSKGAPPVAAPQNAKLTPAAPTTPNVTH